MSFMVIAVAMLAAFLSAIFISDGADEKFLINFYTKLRKKRPGCHRKGKRRFSCRCDRYVCDRSGWSDHRWLLYERIYNACTI